MKQIRPKNLNLFTIHFPIPAIVSILHRVSGVVLFLLVPFMLWVLELSLTVSGYDQLQNWLDLFWLKLTLWLLFIPFCFHLLAGIRHLLMDVHVGTSLAGGRFSAMLTFAMSALIVILVGVWIW